MSARDLDSRAIALQQLDDAQRRLDVAIECQGDGSHLVQILRELRDSALATLDVLDAVRPEARH